MFGFPYGEAPHALCEVEQSKNLWIPNRVAGYKLPAIMHGMAAEGSTPAEHSSSSMQGFQVIHSRELPTVFHMNTPHLCFAGGWYEKHMKIHNEST